MNIITKEEYKGFTIRIWQDSDCAQMFFEDETSGAAGDDCFIVAYHRDFTIDRGRRKDGKYIPGFPLSLAQCIARGGKYEDNSPCLEAQDWIKSHHIFGLEAYIHSGVHLSLSREGNYPDRQWDVSQVGLVLVSKKQWRRRDTAAKRARSYLDYYNDLLSGNVYGFAIEDAAGNMYESCGGYVGDYDETGGPLDEAKANIDRIILDKKEIETMVLN